MEMIECDSGIRFGISAHSIKHQLPEYKYSSTPMSRVSVSLIYKNQNDKLIDY
jgi:hypothetical protein